MMKNSSKISYILAAFMNGILYFLSSSFSFLSVFSFSFFQGCPNISSCNEHSRYHFVYDANTNIILSSEPDVRDIQYILYIILEDHNRITSNQTGRHFVCS